MLTTFIISLATVIGFVLLALLALIALCAPLLKAHEACRPEEDGVTGRQGDQVTKRLDTYA
jgi:putative Mn2+ efflux pump MntP